MGVRGKGKGPFSKRGLSPSPGSKTVHFIISFFPYTLVTRLTSVRVVSPAMALRQPS